jgi:hypothetical protein
MKQKSGPGKAPAEQVASRERARFLQKSNTFLICAAKACSLLNASASLQPASHIAYFQSLTARSRRHS